MSDKPATHAMIELLPNQVALGNNEVTLAILSPDDAVALGYALFEHGLYLKGKMKPQTTGEEK